MASDVDPSSAEFGKYRLLRKLAQGGMAEIFLAIQTGIQGFEKVVVVKRVLPDLSASDDFINMFLDEARIAARLDHTNIVRIYDLGEVNGQYYIAMEYIAGEDLASVLQQCRRQNSMVPIDLAVDTVIGAAEALLFAHELEDNEGNLMHLVHRDVSPSNILITYQGTVKLVDFGIARAESNVSKTQGGQLKGKIQYLSPEQCRGHRVDCRSDIFALGIVLHELLTCKRLFQRDTQLAAMNAILFDPIAPPSALRPDIPPELDEIVMKALEKDPDARYQTAGQLAADLTVFLLRREYSRGGKFVEFLTRLFGEERKKTKLRVAKGLKLDELTRNPNAPVPPGTNPGSGSFSTPGSRPSSSPRTATGDFAPIRSDAKGALPALTPGGSRVAGLQPARPLSSTNIPSAATPPPVPQDDGVLLEGRVVSDVPGRSRKKLAGIAAAVAVVLVAGIVIATQGGSPPPPELPPVVATPDPVKGVAPPPVVPPVENPKPPPGLQVGGIRFEGVPAGARVTLDGSPVGTPGADSFFSAGKHQVVVEAKGFFPYEAQVELTVGNVVAVTPVLKPRPQEARGIIDISCQPWCQIIIDGRDTGKTSPARISVAVGTHTVLLSNAPAGLAKKMSVTVTENAVIKKVVKLDE